MMVALGFFTAAIVYGFNPADLERLKTTNQCSECDLSSAKLTNANLRGANLSGTDLFKADLRGADLQGANLAGADLFVSRVRRRAAGVAGGGRQNTVHGLEHRFHAPEAAATERGGLGFGTGVFGGFG